MARRDYGSLCPDGHGVLLDVRQGPNDDRPTGTLFCPSAAHGGNGRFFYPADVDEGWYDSDAPRQATTYEIEQEQRRAAALIQRQEEDMARAIRQAAAAAAPAAAPAKVKVDKGRDCTCGCGGRTAGGRFLPGHDARYYSALKAQGLEVPAHGKQAAIPADPAVAKAFKAAQAAKGDGVVAAKATPAPKPTRPNPRRRRAAKAAAVSA